MSIPVALLLVGVAALLWRSALRLPAAILAFCVLYTVGGEHSPQVMGALRADLAGGLSGDLLLLGIVAVGFALCCGWKPKRGAGKAD